MKRNNQEYLLLALSAFAVVAIIPFAFIRFVRQDWLIGMVDIVIVIGMTVTFIYVYKTCNIEIPSVGLAIFSAVAAVTSVYVKGVENIYWVYPAVVAAYYLLAYSWASLITFLVVCCLAPLLYTELDIVALISVLTTIFMTSMFGFFFSKSVSEQHDQLSNMATRDSLTKTGNRRALDDKLLEVTTTQARRNSKVSLILLDLDHFKLINDEFGHMIGDQVLVRIAEIIEGRIRLTDALYRFGGEEFVIVPLDMTLDLAEKLAEQLRILVENNVLVPENPVTISLGVAEYRQGETSKHWLNRADEALYQAKRSGRNRVCVTE
jgi:diguanylate cyclase (GGDEF)-like protein